MCVLTEYVCLFCIQCVERDRVVFVLYFFKSFYDFFSLSSFFFFFAVEKTPTDNIEKKSVQSMDTKQANLTRSMWLCLFGTTTQKVVVNNQKASLQPPLLPWSAAREMGSESLWKPSRMSLRINKKRKKKNKKKEFPVLSVSSAWLWWSARPWRVVQGFCFSAGVNHRAERASHKTEDPSALRFY